MNLKIAVYNVEWMRRLFDGSGNPITSGKAQERSQQLARVFNKINADLIGIVEGPDTLADGSRTASGQLEKWVQAFGLNANYKGVHGHPSRGQQELCALYDSSKIKVEFAPSQNKDNRFNAPFLVDTTNKLIKEQYEHYRPPLELRVTNLSDNELMRAIVAHTKSKGIFSPVDMARFEKISERDRMRLFAECMSIRMRCDDYLKNGSNVVVMGDINDGVGLDFYENRFSKSAVEILLGEVWNPELILTHVLPKPRWTSNGWKPFSSNFRDRLTEDTVNVLIDHMLISRQFRLIEGKIWNPEMYEDDPEIQEVEEALREASDHYPISAVVEV